MPDFLKKMAGGAYQISWSLVDVAQITGFPVQELMGCVVGIHRELGRNFEFSWREFEEKHWPEEFLQRNKPADPWYYRGIAENAKYIQDNGKPFLCWKGREYQWTERIQWNFVKIPLIRDSQGIRKITHREAARLKGFPDSFILAETDRQWLYRKIIYSGNLSVIRQAAGALAYILADNPWRSRQASQAFRFEELFGRYLSRLEEKNADVSGVEKLAEHHVHHADFEIRYGNESLYFEIKWYKGNVLPRLNIIRACQRLTPLKSEGIPILVIANEVPQSQKIQCEKEFGVHIWDVSNLLWIFEAFPDIKAEFIASLDFSVEHIEPEPPVPAITAGKPEKKAEELSWKERLLRIPPGKKHFTEYEQICIEILKYVFGDYLTLWASQEKSGGGLYRFDLCCKIKSGIEQDFFDTIMHYFNTKYIVFEFKNYSEKITQKEIYTTEKYLYEKALRKVAVIISRAGADEHAQQAAKGSLREYGKLIICLSDNSLLEMIDIKEHGEREPAEFLEAILDDLLVHLEK